MKITINETVSKCGHILVTIEGHTIVTTKKEMLSDEILDTGDTLKELIILNNARLFIKLSGKTDWGSIKTDVDKKEFNI